MRVPLDRTAQEWADKARRFADEELIPHEVEAEMNGGRLPADVTKRHHELAVELGFSAMDVPAEYGGLALRNVDQVAVWEQLGRVTNALCWCFSEPHQWMFEACNEDQLQRYVLPLMSGARKECYAITEQESGSDVVIETTADRADGGYRLNGEKWFVTSANLADFFFFQARIPEEDDVAVGEVHAPEDAARIRDAIDRAGAAEILEGLPQGLDTQLGTIYDDGQELSVGQWQRLAIARAWFRDAPLLILDEPSAALDPRAEHALFRDVERLASDRTVVLITHRLANISSADEIVVLHEGQVVERGRHDDLLRRGGRYAELFRLQAAGFDAGGASHSQPSGRPSDGHG